MPDSLPLAEFEKYAFPIFNEAYGISSIPQGAIHINLYIYIYVYINVHRTGMSIVALTNIFKK